jgi:hypothetical protein
MSAKTTAAGVKGSGTSSSGPVLHLLYKGPTIGYAYDYSGAVTGPVLYVIDNGPTLGLQLSAT